MLKEAIAFDRLQEQHRTRWRAPLRSRLQLSVAFCSYGILDHAEMRVLSFVLVVILLSSAPAAGQEPSVPNAASTCTYDACALRLEQRRLLRGAEGQPILSLGTWGAPSLRPYVASSDSALAYAAEFDRHYTVGTRVGFLGLLGAAVAGALFASYDSALSSDRPVMVPLGVVAVSLGLTVYGGRRMDRAMRSLSRAIWWYNRDLPR